MGGGGYHVIIPIYIFFYYQQVQKPVLGSLLAGIYHVTYYWILIERCKLQPVASVLIFHLRGHTIFPFLTPTHHLWSNKHQHQITKRVE